MFGRVDKLPGRVVDRNVLSATGSFSVKLCLVYFFLRVPFLESEAGKLILAGFLSLISQLLIRYVDHRLKRRK